MSAITCQGCVHHNLSFTIALLRYPLRTDTELNHRTHLAAGRAESGDEGPSEWICTWCPIISSETHQYIVLETCNPLVAILYQPGSSGDALEIKTKPASRHCCAVQCRPGRSRTSWARTPKVMPFARPCRFAEPQPRQWVQNAEMVECDFPQESPMPNRFCFLCRVIERRRPPSPESLVLAALCKRRCRHTPSTCLPRPYRLYPSHWIGFPAIGLMQEWSRTR